MSVDDKYTYPGSGGVLVNHLGIRDAVLLDRALNDHASIEWAQLRREPLPERFDVAELQRIHLRLFHAVYPFAGQLRDVDAQATGTGIPYSRPEFIPTQAVRSTTGCAATTTSAGCLTTSSSTDSPTTGAS